MDKLESDTGSGALRRGLRVVMALYQAGSAGLKVAEIAQATGLPRPTVYRLLAALVQEEFVLPLEAGKRFICALPDRPQPLPQWDAMVRRLIPPMQKVAAKTGNSVYLIRCVESDSCCLHREFGWYPIQINTLAVQKSQPLGVGAAGLALLAAYPDAEVDRILERNAPRLARYGNMTTGLMRQLVRNTRDRGYAVVGNYAVPGVSGTGVALYDKARRAVAAISVCSIIERMPSAQQRAVARLLRAEFGEI